MPNVCAKHVAGPFNAADQPLIDPPIRVVEIALHDDRRAAP